MTESGLPVPAAVSVVRRGWILFFGIVELLIGAFFSLIVVLVMGVALFAERLPPPRFAAMNKVTMGFSSLFHGALALLFVLAGAGTIGGRRWARLLMIVVSSIWMAFGVLAASIVLILLPAIRGSIGKSGPAVSAQTMAAVWILLGGFALFSYVLLPGVLLFFYTRKSVKAAFAKSGQEPPGGRRVPIPVVGLAVWLGIGALSSLLSLPYGFIAVFGLIVTGFPAIGLHLANAGLQGYLAWRLCRRENWIWWVVLIAYLLMGVSGWVTFRRIPMAEMVERMHPGLFRRPELQPMLDLMQTKLPPLMLIVNLAFFGLVLFVKRYFRSGTGAEERVATG